MTKDRLAMIEALLERGSQDPFHWYARAMELRSRDALEAALDAYGDVRDRFPGYVPTYLMAAQVAQELERLDDARRWAQGGVEQARAVGDGHAERELSQFLDLL